MRFVHFSDIHLESGFDGVPARAFLNKRFVGWANLALRRRRHYQGATERLEALESFAREIGVDVALCTGDHTALGTEPELAQARAALGPFERLPRGLVTIPGNHDVYLEDALARFEAHFGDLLRSDRPELATDGRWPLVRLFGDDVATVAVDSSRPNPSILSSSGRVPDAQLEGLERALEALADRFVFVMTHYAPRLASGRPDSVSHGLDNADDFLSATARARRGAIIHGHVHHCFVVRVPETSLPIFNAGSTTLTGREGLWVYDVDGTRATATRGRFVEGRWTLDEDSRVDI